MNSLRLAVLMGGVSNEREVSLRSGVAVVEALRSRGHTVTPVDVRGEKLRDFLPPDSFDAVFIALHGRFGEDGKVQRQCEELGLPYTGSGPRASALALDKVRSKEIFMRHEILTPAYEVLQSSTEKDLARLERLGFPLVVKPPLEGSSIGLSIAREKKDVRRAVEEALRYGDSALVEVYVAGKEWTVGILGEIALPVIQIVPKKGIYDYHAKYTPGQTQYLAPAPEDETVTMGVQKIALEAFGALGCEDFGRVDFIGGPDGTPFVLEVNTIPGFTQTSLLPKAARAAGIDFASLCERIVALCTSKAEARG